MWLSFSYTVYSPAGIVALPAVKAKGTVTWRSSPPKEGSAANDIPMAENASSVLSLLVIVFSFQYGRKLFTGKPVSDLLPPRTRRVQTCPLRHTSGLRRENPTGDFVSSDRQQKPGDHGQGPIR